MVALSVKRRRNQMILKWVIILLILLLLLSCIIYSILYYQNKDPNSKLFQPQILLSVWGFGIVFIFILISLLIYSYISEDVAISEVPFGEHSEYPDLTLDDQ